MFFVLYLSTKKTKDFRRSNVPRLTHHLVSSFSPPFEEFEINKRKEKYPKSPKKSKTFINSLVSGSSIIFIKNPMTANMSIILVLALKNMGNKALKW